MWYDVKRPFKNFRPFGPFIGDGSEDVSQEAATTPTQPTDTPSLPDRDNQDLTDTERKVIVPETTVVDEYIKDLQ